MKNKVVLYTQKVAHEQQIQNEDGEILLSYAKLRGRICEKFGTQTKFAEAMGMNLVALSRRLNGVIGWTQSEIVLAVKLLDIPVEEIWEYFFTD